MAQKGFDKPTIDKFENLDLGQNKPQGPQLASSNLLPSKNGIQELASIKKAGEKEILTPQQFKELAKEVKRCRNDVLYFCRKYFMIVSLKDGLTHLTPYPKQEQLLKFIQDNNRAIVCASRQVGKCVQQNSTITIRNKITGVEETITIEEFFNRVSSDSEQNREEPQESV